MAVADPLPPAFQNRMSPSTPLVCGVGEPVRTLRCQPAECLAFGSEIAFASDDGRGQVPPLGPVVVHDTHIGLTDGAFHARRNRHSRDRLAERLTGNGIVAHNLRPFSRQGPGLTGSPTIPERRPSP